MKPFTLNFRLLAATMAVLGLFLLLSVNEVSAVGLGTAPGGVPSASFGSGGDSPEQAVATLAGLIQRITDGLAAVAAAVAVLFFVINAARLVFSLGSSEELGKAKKGLIWASAGLVLIIFAYIIAKTVIALTFSGADGSSALGTSLTNTRPVATQPVAGDDNPDGKCKQPGPLPDPCYGGASLANQSKTGGENCDAEAAEALAGVCKDFEVDDCTIQNLQQKLNDGGHYEAAGITTPSCTKADGKYGECTFRSLKKIYSKQCIK